MARVTREMVEKTGIKVDDLLKLLIRNAAAELTTYYYYTILRVNLVGLEGEGLGPPHLRAWWQTTRRHESLS